MAISFVRTVLLYILIIGAVRLMGKRQISQLQTSELVVMLLISDLAVIPMQDSAQPLAGGIIPIMVLVVCELGLSFVMLRSTRVRRLICGLPVLIIQDGKILRKNMALLRMSVEDLFEQLRQKDIFNLADVAYAVIETNGTLSICKKALQDCVTPAQLGLTDAAVEPENMEIVVVSDGCVTQNSLQLLQKDVAWLHRVLQSEHTALCDIFIMTVGTRGGYTIIRKDAVA